MGEENLISSIGSTPAGSGAAQSAGSVAGGSRNSSKISGAELQYQADESAALKFTTADGDTVVISVEAMQQLQAESYSASQGGSSSSGSEEVLTTAAEVSVASSGPLSRQDVADIRAVLGQLGNLLNDSANGDTAAVAKDVASIGSLTGIQSVQFGYAQQAQGQLTLLAGTTGLAGSTAAGATSA